MVDEANNIQEVPGVIRCPKCGTTAEAGEIRYVEHIECWRRVHKVEEGTVKIEGRYTTDEGYDEGHDPYLECHSYRPITEEETATLGRIGVAEDVGVKTVQCMHQWPVPEWVLKNVDWV